eukprot:tig00000057_g23.t1
MPALFFPLSGVAAGVLGRNPSAHAFPLVDSQEGMRLLALVRRETLERFVAAGGIRVPVARRAGPSPVPGAGRWAGASPALRMLGLGGRGEAPLGLGVGPSFGERLRAALAPSPAVAGKAPPGGGSRHHRLPLVEEGGEEGGEMEAIGVGAGAGDAPSTPAPRFTLLGGDDGDLGSPSGGEEEEGDGAAGPLAPRAAAATPAPGTAPAPAPAPAPGRGTEMERPSLELGSPAGSEEGDAPSDGELQPAAGALIDWPRLALEPPPLCVGADAAMGQVHALFSLLSCSELLVLHRGRLRGVITRQRLVDACSRRGGPVAPVA